MFIYGLSIFLTSTGLIKDKKFVKSNAKVLLTLGYQNLTSYLPGGRKKPSPVGEGGSRRLTDEELVWRLITPHPPLSRSPFPHWGRLGWYTPICLQTDGILVVVFN